MKSDSKYQPLYEYLQKSDRYEIILTFAEIEILMQNPLPDSAKTKKAWWSNRHKGALQATAWMSAGYRVENIDFESESVTFRKPTPKTPIRRVGDTVLWNADLIKALRLYLELTQAEFAEKLGVRQQTVSEWENGLYTPTRSKSKHLELVADVSRFNYIKESEIQIL